MRERAQWARTRTLGRVAELGFPEPPAHLPLLADDQSPFVLRPAQEVVDRALVLTVRINLAFRMRPETARDWLATNDLLDCLTHHESELVGGSAIAGDEEKVQVEALWALAWALGLTPGELDHQTYCGDELASLLPDLRAQEPAQAWRSRLAPQLRPAADVLAELDLLYAMTWGLVDARLSSRPAPGVVEPYVLWERRRALEFLRAEEDGIDPSDWDMIDLST